MIFRIFILIFVFTFSVKTNLFCHQIEIAKINGGFKSCIVNSYNYIDGKIDFNSKHQVSFSKYNDKGYLIEKIESKSKDTVSFRILFFYDEFNKLIEQMDYKGNLLSLKTIYKYDDTGNNCEMSEYNKNDSLWFFETSQFDKEDKIIKHTHFWADGYMIFEEFFVYDENNNLIDCLGYYPGGFIKHSENFQYNNENLKIMSVHYEYGRCVWIKYTYKYDKYNKLVEQRYYLADSISTSKDVFIYDDYSNIIEKVTYELSIDNDSVKPVSKLEYIYSK